VLLGLDSDGRAVSVWDVCEERGVDARRQSRLPRTRLAHPTSTVIDEPGQRRGVGRAEQAAPVATGYAWSGRMRATGDVVETMIPRRLDRLPWSRWHWLVVIGLGITWILDGFEVTLVGAIASMLTNKDALGLTTQQAASAGTFYLVGAITGAFVFGYLTDRSGRKKLFTITLAIYLVFTVASGLAWNYWSFVIFRLLAGAGIGGEYSAINSAIDELIPARVRGRVALAINGSWWVGTAGAAFFSYVLLHGISESIGWRLGFFVGATLALGIIIIRRFIPESPRWLLTHGRPAEAEQVVAQIEDAVRRQHPDLPKPEGAPIVIEQRERLSFLAIAKYVIQKYPQRGLLGLALMTGQAFLYNAIFFTYTLVLTEFFDVSAKTAPLYLIPFAVGNFLGPLLLGPLFDTLGRRVMIPFTYITSGLFLIATGQLFVHDMLTETTMTIAWCVIFFFASAGASSAYLSVSELFPLEARAMAISLFYAFGTGLAAFAPTLFGALIQSASRTNVNYGYLIGAGLMLAAGLVAAFLAVPAERRSLEDLASPYTAVRGRGPTSIAAPARAS
jgi:MFS family permease